MYRKENCAERVYVKMELRLKGIMIPILREKTPSSSKIIRYPFFSAFFCRMASRISVCHVRSKPEKIAKITLKMVTVALGLCIAKEHVRASYFQS